MGLADRFGRALDAFRGYRAPISASPGELAFADPYKFVGGAASFQAYNPSILITTKGLDVFDAMRRDDQVKASLAFKKQAVLATGWEIAPPEGKDGEDECTKFIQENFGKIQGTFDATLLQILTALDFGYSVSEKVYEERDGKIWMVALKTKRPRPFNFIMDGFGNVTGLRQDGNGASLPIEKFLIYRHQYEFGNPYGTSDLDAAYRAWFAKDNAYKWMLMMLEKYGVPPIVAMYDPNAYDGNTLNVLKTVLANLQASTSAIVRRPSTAHGESAPLEFWAPELAGQVSTVFVPAIEMLNRDIARAILMPGNMGMTPEKITGSFAKAKVDFDVFMFVVEYLRKDLATAITEDLVRPLCAMNFAADDIPTFIFPPLTDEQAGIMLAEWREQVKVGTVTVTPEDEDYIRERLEFPAIADEFKAQTPGDMLPMPPVGGGAGLLPPPGSAPPAPTPQAKQNVVYDYAEGTRELTEAEKRANLTQIGATLDALEAAGVKRLGAVLAKSRDVMTAKLKDTGLPDANAVRMMKLPGKVRFDRAMQAHLLEAFKAGRLAMDTGVGKVKRHRVGDPITYSPTEALNYLANKAMVLAGTTSDKLLSMVKQALLFSLKAGEGTAAASVRLRGAFDEYAADGQATVDGAPVTPSRLETIVRTNTTDAFNQGRLAEARRPELQGIVTAMQYSAILDTRTTPLCRGLDRKVFAIDDPQLDQLTPPNHFNCRSVLVPITFDMEIPQEDMATPEDIGKAKGLRTFTLQLGQGTEANG